MPKKTPPEISYPIVAVTISILAILVSLAIFLKEFINIGPGFFSDVATTTVAATLGAIFSALLGYFLGRMRKPIAKVFISYSAKDADFVKQLSQDLYQGSFQVLKDNEAVLIGDNFSDKVSESISESDFVIIVISKHATSSQSILKEIEYATKLGKKIFPVLKEEADVPATLSSLRYADFTDDYKSALNLLMKSLQANARVSQK